MPARKKSTVKKIVVAHIDRFVLTIPTEKENVLFLSEHLTGFFQRIANGFSEKRDWQEHRNKKTGRYDAYDFRAAISKLRFKPHPQLADFVKENNRFPTWSELFKMGFRGNWLVEIRLTDRRKWDYLRHTENIYDALKLIGKSLELEPRILEIALDTQSKKLGMLLRKFGCLIRPPRVNSLFHFDKQGEFIQGPSPNACNEYMGYWPKGHYDLRSSMKRPRGGRRQIHSYDRKVPLGPHIDYKFPRFELRLYRDYLRDYLKQYPVLRPCELIDHMQHLIETNIRFSQVDLPRIFEEIPASKQWNLTGMSSKGQIYVMEQRGISKSIWERYIIALPFPPIYYCTDPFPDEHSSQIIDYGYTLFSLLAYNKRKIQNRR